MQILLSVKFLFVGLPPRRLPSYEKRASKNSPLQKVLRRNILLTDRNFLFTEWVSNECSKTYLRIRLSTNSFYHPTISARTVKTILTACTNYVLSWEHRGATSTGTGLGRLKKACELLIVPSDTRKWMFCCVTKPLSVSYWPENQNITASTQHYIQKFACGESGIHSMNHGYTFSNVTQGTLYHTASSLISKTFSHPRRIPMHSRIHSSSRQMLYFCFTWYDANFTVTRKQISHCIFLLTWLLILSYLYVTLFLLYPCS